MRAWQLNHTGHNFPHGELNFSEHRRIFFEKLNLKNDFFGNKKKLESYFKAVANITSKLDEK